jgi:CelD/BcsL family acetyltransferase involved in cellulose biosynthesis
MDYHLIRSEAEFDQLAEPWNMLLDESTTHVPFLRHEYLQIWWQNRGGGEWQDGELAIVTATEGERLVGIAPLFRATNRDGQPALLLLGSIEISDFLDVIAREADLEAFVGGLLDYLPGADLPEWRLLDLYNLLDSSPTLPVLERAARTRGWGYAVEQLQHSPYIPLPGSWDTYLASLDKKQRHEIRRKMRRAAESALEVQFYIVEDGAALGSEIEAFLELMAHDPNKANFLHPAMRTHIAGVIRTAFQNRYLWLAFLMIGGKKAAAALNFDYANKLWGYNSGVSRDYMELSPGWVLLTHQIQWACDHGRNEFDFMRGDEDYKYRFGGVDRHVMRVVVAPHAA